MIDRKTTERIRESAKRAMRPALTTSRLLVAIIVPVSLVIAVLDWSGVVGYIARALAPVMGLFGLPGEAALAFLSGALINIYPAIGVMSGLSLSARSMTIIALMCLITHNMIVETAVLRKMGMPAWLSVILRFSMSLVAAFIVNLILPGRPSFHLAEGAVLTPIAFPAPAALLPLLREWAVSTVFLIIKMVAIIILLMVAEKILEEFKTIDYLTLVFKPVMGVFGLPESVSFLWIIANTLGIAYGAAVMIERRENGSLSADDGKLFNLHIAISHSLLEDTLIFFAAGVDLFWILVPRLILALAAVWGERARRVLFRRSFEVGTM